MFEHFIKNKFCNYYFFQKKPNGKLLVKCTWRFVKNSRVLFPITFNYDMLRGVK